MGVLNGTVPPVLGTLLAKNCQKCKQKLAQSAGRKKIDLLGGVPGIPWLGSDPLCRWGGGSVQEGGGVGPHLKPIQPPYIKPWGGSGESPLGELNNNLGGGGWVSPPALKENHDPKIGTTGNTGEWGIDLPPPPIAFRGLS